MSVLSWTRRSSPRVQKANADLISARAAVPGTRSAIAAAATSSQRLPATLSVCHSQFAFDLLAAALLALDFFILVAHRADDFKFLLTRLTFVFVNGHRQPAPK